MPGLYHQVWDLVWDSNEYYYKIEAQHKPLISLFLTVLLHSSFLSFQFRVFTAPFHRVEFADFWLADQLNSLVVVLMDLEYLICFYIFELQWGNTKGLLPSASKILGEGQNGMNDLYALCTSACCHKELDFLLTIQSIFNIPHQLLLVNTLFFIFYKEQYKMHLNISIDQNDCITVKSSKWPSAGIETRYLNVNFKLVLILDGIHSILSTPHVNLRMRLSLKSLTHKYGRLSWQCARHSPDMWHEQGFNCCPSTPPTVTPRLICSQLTWS